MDILTAGAGIIFAITTRPVTPPCARASARARVLGFLPPPFLLPGCLSHLLHRAVFPCCSFDENGALFVYALLYSSYLLLTTSY